MKEDCFDNAAYTERRAALADEAEARVTALAAQNARRWKAIDETIKQLVNVLLQADDPGYVQHVAKGLIVKLSAANRMRSDDPQGEQGESHRGLSQS